MTPVEFHFVLPTGEPLANMAAEIQLAYSTYSDLTDGVAMPRPIKVITDVDGKVTVGLWPSTTFYYVTVQDTESEAGLSYKFLVTEAAPGMTLRLQDIIVDGTAPAGATFENAIVLSVMEAKANARASELAAAASATAAAASAATLTGANLVAAMDAAIGGPSWKAAVQALTNGVLLSNTPITGIDIRGSGVSASLVNGVLVLDFTGSGVNPLNPTTGSISLQGAGALYLVGAGLINLA